MDIGVFRGIVTAVLLVLFVGLWFRSWSRKRKDEYDAASRMPLGDDQRPPETNNEREQHS